MPEVVTPRGARAVISEPEDAVLLKAIAIQRDEKSFLVLYERHHVHAYSLALQISRNSDVAEEAVQEALARIWQRAESFVPEGSARGWILRIVARETLMLLRKKRKDARMKVLARSWENSEEPGPAAPAEGAARNEILEGLRKVLDRLPQQDRLMVTLYYGAGMSQQEIGSALEMPRTTVTKRMQDGLAGLRLALEQAGFAAALPLLSTEGFGELMTAGVSIPAGLQRKVALRIASRTAGAVSRRAVVPISSTSWWTLGVVIALASAGTGAWWWRAQPPSTSTSTSTNASKSALAPGILGHWLFNEGPAKDIKVLAGNWDWKGPAGKEPGCMWASAHTRVLLPLTLPNMPIRITMRYRPHRQGDVFNFSSNRTDGMEIPAGWVWNKPDLKLPRRTEYTLQGFLIDKYAIGLLPEDSIVFGVIYIDSSTANKIAISLNNIEVREIEVRALASEELPETMKDIPALIKSLGVVGREAPAERLTP